MSILIQLHRKPIKSHSIVLDVQSGVYVEISGFWQRQEVWSTDTYEQSLILVRVQKTRRAYKSQ
jgi:hypothetical protein